MNKCQWALASLSEEIYHDKEWGVPIHNDRLLFEALSLEGAQAGLSWAIILNKRQGYRAAFDQFDFEKIAQYDEQKIQQLFNNPHIVRHKLKIHSVITNAQVLLKIQQYYGSFDHYIWQFVGYQTLQNHRQSADEIPASTTESIHMSRSLKQQGFKFVGETTCYAYMQAVGMVNDHTTDCFRYRE